MAHYVFPAQASAQAVAAAVDAAMGYPRVSTQTVGGGVPAAPAVTQTYAQVQAHPSLPLWAYPALPAVVTIVGPSAVQLGLPAPTTLDATWTVPLPASAVAVGT